MGIIAGILSLFAYIPYIAGIIRRKIQPERSLYLIWTLMHVLTVMSYYALGARETIWVPLAFVVGSATITVLSFFYGKEGWGIIEKFALGVAFISAVRWIYFNSVLFALAANLAISIISYVPGVKRRLENPKEDEDLIGWTLFFVGSLLNLFAITNWSLAIASLPVVVFVEHGAVFGVTAFNRFFRKEQAAKETDASTPPQA